MNFPGWPGFNFFRPPMNFPGNMPNNGNMMGHGMNQGFGMMPINYPSYNRPAFQRDFQFSENPDTDVHGNSFWVGSFQQRECTVIDRTFIKNKTRSVVIKQVPIEDDIKEKTALNQQQMPVFSQPSTSEVEQQKETGTQNGETKMHVAACTTGDDDDDSEDDDDETTQSHKKLKTDETNPPAELPKVAKKYGWQGNPKTIFSCSLCQYQTQDETEIQKHFYSNQHKEILRHLCIFFPKHRVDFLHEYLLFMKNKMSIQRQTKKLNPIRDSFTGVGVEHYLHRIQAVHCLACDVVIPDVRHLLIEHTKSDVHKQKGKDISRNTKTNSLAVAKKLLLDSDVLQMLKKYNQGQNPFKDIPVYSPHVSSTQEVLVAEEDDVVNYFEDDIADDKDGQEVPVNHNEDPAHDEDSEKKLLITNEPEEKGPDPIPKEAPSPTIYTDGSVKEVEEAEEEEAEEAAEAP
ncbi:uncharacterized protein LOC142750038 isoform X2 [Rhinoderma darwinii]|uniref:uncharacterized protein LOC142750038 isoform X2 n=1 Tax=Rhinoderma darwinii TaxID=43563 RepID=UPI003F679C7C